MRRLAQVVRVGSPAWAGIDPIDAGADGGIARFPRVGGDRPVI